MGGKPQYGYFKRQTSDITHKKTRTWLWKGNLKRENEYLLMAAENNAIRTNYFQAKVNITQQNNKSGLCTERDQKLLIANG